MERPPRRPLGRTGLMVSAIGLGTVKIGRDQGVKYPAAFALPDDAAVAALLEGALARGVTLIDTAPAYGTSEARLAPFFARHRDACALCTKAGETFELDAAGTGSSRFDFRPASIEASLVRSLRRLGTDRVDILLLHSDGRDLEILELPGLIDQLLELRTRGLARAIGISAKTSAGIDRAVALGLDVVMAAYSRVDRAREDAIERAHARGLGVLAIKGLASGHLAADGSPVERARAAHDAVRFVTTRPFVDALVVGTLSLAHLEQAIDAAAGAGPECSAG